MKAFLVAALLAFGSVSADLEIFYRDTLLPPKGKIVDPLSSIDGLSGADQLCMSTGGKRFVAAMSDGHTHMKHRFGENEPIVRHSDGVVLAPNRDVMFTATGVSSVIQSYNGVIPSTDYRVFTGAGDSGTNTGDNCNGWRDNTISFRGELGIPSSTATTQWFRSTARDCNLPTLPESSIYCIEQTKVACIFVTDAPVSLITHNGKAALDQHCQDTFSNGKAITAEFAALVSDGNGDAIDVFPGEEGSYMLINTEGNIVQTLQYELFRRGTLFDNQILTLGRTVPVETRVWSGSKNVVDPSVDANSDYGVNDGSNNCVNWNSNAFPQVTLASLTGAYGDVSKTNSGMLVDGTVPCDTSLNVVCVQTSAITTSTVHGDPHFAGFDGSRYNFDGVNGEIFNIITDSNFLLNAEFTEMEIFETKGTWMTKLGFRSGKETIVFDPAFGILVNNEELVKSGDHFATEEFEVDIQWKNQRPANIIVRASGYEVSIKPVQYEPGKIYLDVQVALFVNPVKPHGVLGQTAKYIVDGTEPKATNTKAKNAEDLLEGVYTDYLVKDGILGTDFTFNTFEGLISGRGHVQTRNFAVARSSFVPVSWKESF